MLRRANETGQRDLSIALGVLQFVTAIIAALGAFVVAALSPGPILRFVALLAVLAGTVGGGGVTLWRNNREKRAKLAAATEKVSLERQLEAERIRILTLTSGAFLGTARALQGLAALPLKEKREQVSGFRQSVVEKACDLVRNERPRAAYFRIVASDAGKRSMVPQHHAQRERTDEFTAEFIEGSGLDENVWRLVDDEARTEHVYDVQVDAPAGFDASRERAYRSYVSVPVCAAGVAFGMLTINSVEAGGFAAEDVAAMKVLARMLATAEIITLTTQTWVTLRAQAKVRKGDAYGE